MATIKKKSLIEGMGPASAALVKPPAVPGKVAARNLAATKLIAAKASAAKTIVAKGLLTAKK